MRSLIKEIRSVNTIKTKKEELEPYPGRRGMNVCRKDLNGMSSVDKNNYINVNVNNRTHQQYISVHTERNKQQMLVFQTVHVSK